MLTACNSSRAPPCGCFSQPIRLFCREMLCTRNSLRLAGGTCCSNAHARRCCGSLRFEAENILRAFHTSLLRRDTAVNARSNPTAFTLSSKRKIVLQRPSLGLRWRLITDAPRYGTAGMACRSETGFHRGRQKMLAMYLRPCLFTMSRTVSLTVQG